MQYKWATDIKAALRSCKGGGGGTKRKKEKREEWRGGERKRGSFPH